MAKRNSALRRQLLGFVVSSVSTALIVGVFAFATGEPWNEDHETLTAHFASVSGLKRSSDVLLSGKKVGRVEEVSFITTQYDCDPDHEDRGRRDQRTDDCEARAFCVAQADGAGLCAELERYTGSSGDYEDKRCLADEACADTEVCVTDAFRGRNHHIAWFGPKNSCVTFHTEHSRVEVTLSIQPDMLEFIRTDSRASVASKGVLGDQQISITVGSGDPLPAGSRIHSTPTLLEELNQFRERIGAITEKFQGNFASLREVGGAMQDDRAERRDSRSTLAEYSDATSDIVNHDGQLGLLFQSDARNDLMVSLGELQGSADRFAADARQFRRKGTKELRSASSAMHDISIGSESAMDSGKLGESTATRLVLDERLGLEIAERTHTAAESLTGTKTQIADLQAGVDDLRQQFETGEGALGELLRSPDTYYAFVKAIAMFDMLDRNDGLKSAARQAIHAGDSWEDFDPETDGAVARDSNPAAAEAKTGSEPGQMRGPPPPPPPAPEPTPPKQPAETSPKP